MLNEWLKAVILLPFNVVFFSPFCSEVFFVIARAKARRNPAFSGRKLGDYLKFKTDQNGLLLV